MTVFRTPRTAALALAAIAFLGPSLAAPFPASAAAGCRGNACDGRNPEASGCRADARDVPNSHVRPGSQKTPRVWARYSPGCHAVWAKADRADGWTLRIQVLDGPSYDAPTKASTEAFTAMVGADRKHRVCILDVDGQWECGAWRRGG
ncbi:DUF2690 domain-containing protein [Kitasatospora sp. NPDC054939]